MFQEFRTQNKTRLFNNCFISYLGISYFISVCPVRDMQRFDFKNSIIAIKLFLAMIFKSVFNLRMISK